MKRLPQVDSLRAIAVTAVILFHFYPSSFPGGYIGVDIFFVISGFIISTITYKEIDGKIFSALNYFKRRIYRIIPTLIMVLIIAWIAGIYILQDKSYINLLNYIYGASFFIPNYINYNDTSYFDKNVFSKPLLHLWTLGVEEQFYLIFPIIVLLYKSHIKLYLIALFSLGILSLAFCIYISNINMSYAFYLPLTRVWELILGCIAGYIYINKFTHKFVNQYKYDFIVLFSLLIIFYCIFLYDDKLTYPSFYALLPCISTFLLLIYIEKSKYLKNIFNIRILIWIGLISYPLYLYHWLLISYGKLVYGDNFSEAIAILLLIFIAACNYYTIEYFFRNYRNKIPAFIIVATLFFIGISSLLTNQSYTVKRESLLTGEIQLPNEKNTFTGAILDNNDEFLWPSYLNLNCENNFNLNQFPKENTIFCRQNIAKSPNVALIGDSISDSLYPGFSILSNDSDSGLLHLGMVGCPPIQNVIKREKWNSKCQLFNRSVYDYLESNKTIKHVIMSFAAYDFDAIETECDGKIVKFSENQSCFFDNLLSGIRRLQKSGKHVLINYDFIRLSFDPKLCIKSGDPEGKYCTVKKLNMDADNLRNIDTISNFLALHGNIDVLKLSPYFYDGKDYKIVKEGNILYRDSGHVSIFGSKYLAYKLLDIDVFYKIFSSKFGNYEYKDKLKNKLINSSLENNFLTDSDKRELSANRVNINIPSEVYYHAAKLLKNENDETSKKSIRFLMYASNMNYAAASYSLGEIYLNKKSRIYNEKLGIKYLEESVSLGYVPALYYLGMYFSGSIDLNDRQKGLDYLKQAASKEFAPAHYALAEIDSKKGSEQSIKSYEAASDLNFAPAQYALGIIYGEKGVGSEALSKRYLLLAANNNFAPAMFALHKLHAVDNPLLFNAEMLDLLKRSSELGYAPAQFELGKYLYLHKEASGSDYKRLINKAAEAGFLPAIDFKNNHMSDFSSN